MFSVFRSDEDEEVVSVTDQAYVRLDNHIGTSGFIRVLANTRYFLILHYFSLLQL